MKNNQPTVRTAKTILMLSAIGFLLTLSFFLSACGTHVAPSVTPEALPQVGSDHQLNDRSTHSSPTLIQGFLVYRLCSFK